MSDKDRILGWIMDWENKHPEPWKEPTDEQVWDMAQLIDKIKELLLNG